MSKDYEYELAQKNAIIDRQRKRKKRKSTMRLIGKTALFVMLVAVLIMSVWFLKNGKTVLQGKKGTDELVAAEKDGTTSTDIAASGQQDTDEQVVETKDPKAYLEKAEAMIVQYDYDGAIEYLQSFPDYENNAEIHTRIAELKAEKMDLVPVDVDKVPHIFYHSLINNKKKVFDGDNEEQGYNEYMTTIEEFDRITQEMYDNGYVLVRLKDLVKEVEGDDGQVHFEKNNELLLPEGKKAYVLSVDDLSYYHYMLDDGFPDKLIVDENGQVKCHVTNDDGSEEVGDFDVVPRMNTFMEEHPDGCYKGARGMIALTGYNGVLGYRTDSDYRDKLALTTDQQAFLDATPDFDFDKEIEEAKVVAQAVKDSGWEFASHTWGHINVQEKDLATIKTDNEKWKENVESIVGNTDIIIFAFGADIGTWKDYDTTNEKFNYLKEQGFNYYCNVDSSPYWVQIRDNYVRQGRRNIDGLLLYKSLTVDNNLEDLFHVEDVFDKDRPTPITQQ